MIGSFVIVFREILEAALVITILLAATRGLIGRNRWIGAGVSVGVIGAIIVAFFAGGIADAFEGIGQELFNAGVLFCAVLMLAWHNIWISSHARELTASLKRVGSEVSTGDLPFYFLSVAAGLAVLREGSEIVLFLYGISAGGESVMQMATGSVLGLAAGVVVGVFLYTGLLFRVTGWLILLLAAGMAATASGYLSQAGLLPSLKPLWNTSEFLSENSVVGQLLHILIGYQSRPTMVDMGFYFGTLILIGSGMYLVGKQKVRPSPAIDQSSAVQVN
jgi:high-affinity iron transporter